MTTDLPPTLGWEALAFIEANCSQGPGDLQDEPFHVTDDQLRFLLDAYSIDPTSGRKRYRRAALIRGKGHGKSSFAAAIILFEALGNCRFSHWDADHNPVGKPVSGPQIRVVATAEEQAGNVWDGCVDMARRMNRPDLDVGLSRIILPDGGSIKPVSSSAAARDGGRETFVVADEGHLWRLPEMHNLHQTFVRNLSKRHASQAWMLEISTAFRPGQNSVLENTMNHGMKVLSGEISDPHLLYDHRVIPADKYDLDDPEQRMAALRESYGEHLAFVDSDQISRLWDDPQTDPVDWRRYFLSQVVISSDTFIAPSEWAPLADATLALHDGDAVALGLDTSLIDDGTALVACRLEDGFTSILGYWQRPEGRESFEWTVPYNEVDDAVRVAVERFRVTRCYCDPQYVNAYLDQWTRDFPGHFFSWYTNRPVPMSAALSRFYVAVRTQTDIRHDGDSLLSRHVANARVYTSSGRQLIRKEYGKSPNKIDALMAAVLAYEARADSISAGEDVEKVERTSRRAWSF